MNLRQAEVFRAVMLAGSIGGGAAALHVSAPAVSRMLSHLQTRLGVQLFHRHGGRLQPTPEASALMAEIDIAWRHIDRVRGAAQALRLGGGATLRVASNLSTALELVPRALARLRQQRPGQRVVVEVATLSAMRDGLRAGDIDVAVGAFVDPQVGALLRWPVGQGQLHVVLPAGHPLGELSAVEPAALADAPMVAYGLAGPHGQFIERLLGERATPPLIEVPYAYMACALVACGAGVTLADELTLRHFTGSDVLTRPLAPAVLYDVEALSNPRHAPPAALKLFIDALRDAWSDTTA